MDEMKAATTAKMPTPMAQILTLSANSTIGEMTQHLQKKRGQILKNSTEKSQSKELKEKINTLLELNPQNETECAIAINTVGMDAWLAYLDLERHREAELLRGVYAKEFALTTEELNDDYRILELKKNLGLSSECDGCQGGDKCQRLKEYDKGLKVVVDSRGRATTYRCSLYFNHLQQKKIERQITSAHVPKQYRNAAWCDYEQTGGNITAIKFARKAIKEGTSLFLQGKCGTGKTLLAAIVANESIKLGKNVIFATAPEILADIKSTFDGNNAETAQILKTIKEIPVLVIDDFGAETATKWTAEQFFVIVNYRYNEELQTIFTSNHSLEKIKERFNNVSEETGTRIVARIKAMCKCAEINGRDWRE